MHSTCIPNISREKNCLSLESLLKSLEFLFWIKYASGYFIKINLVFLSSDFGPQRAALDLASEWMPHNVELCPHRVATGDRIGGRAAVGGQSEGDCLAPYVHGGRLPAGHAGPPTERSRETRRLCKGEVRAQGP